MIHERDVRANLASFLRNEISLENFADWIAANSWNMHKDSSPEAVDLVSSIELFLAERDDKTYTDQDFRRDLQTLLDNIIVCDPVNLAANRAPKQYFSANSALVALSLVS
jgi:hypothetical protein